MKPQPSRYDNVLRSYRMERPRDVRPGYVSVQWLNGDGTVWKEVDLREEIIALMRKLAKRDGVTLDAMLACAVWEGMKLRGWAREPDDEEEDEGEGWKGGPTP